MSAPTTIATLPEDPLMPHLLDILSHPASEGLILAGGFGMRVKQAALMEQIREGTTMISSVPPARATQDLDLFLSMDLWIEPEKGMAFRAMLDSLGYAVFPNYQNLQFGKQHDPVTNKYEVKIDLHAREPKDGEAVRFDERRVGKGARKIIGGEDGVHGRTTPEAFAIDGNPTPIQIEGLRTDHTEVQTSVLVPHPYASLNMKVRAAHDWLRAVRGETNVKPYSEKHVFDVYLLIAMMLPGEIEECNDLAGQYADNPQAEEIRQNASALFVDPGGHALLEVRRQIGFDLPYDYDTLWEALQAALGIRR